MSVAGSHSEGRGGTRCGPAAPPPPTAAGADGGGTTGKGKPPSASSSSSSSSSPLKTSKLSDRSTPPDAAAAALGCVHDGAPPGAGAVSVRAAPTGVVAPQGGPPSFRPLASPPVPPVNAERGDGEFGCRPGLGDGSTPSSSSLPAGVRARLRRARAPAARCASRMTALGSTAGAAPSSTADVGTLRLPRGPPADAGVATRERSGLVPTAISRRTSSFRSTRAASPSRYSAGVEKTDSGARPTDPPPWPRADGGGSSSADTAGDPSSSRVAGSGRPAPSRSASSAVPSLSREADSGRPGSSRSGPS